MSALCVPTLTLDAVLVPRDSYPWQIQLLSTVITVQAGSGKRFLAPEPRSYSSFTDISEPLQQRQQGNLG